MLALHILTHIFICYKVNIRVYLLVLNACIIKIKMNKFNKLAINFIRNDSKYCIPIVKYSKQAEIKSPINVHYENKNPRF
jgi:hypothetical protein